MILQLQNLGKIKVQLAKLSRVKEKDERNLNERRLQNIKRFIGWLLWASMTLGVLYGIYKLR